MDNYDLFSSLVLATFGFWWRSKARASLLAKKLFLSNDCSSLSFFYRDFWLEWSPPRPQFPHSELGYSSLFYRWTRIGRGPSSFGEGTITLMSFNSPNVSRCPALKNSFYWLSRSVSCIELCLTSIVFCFLTDGGFVYYLLLDAAPSWIADWPLLSAPMMRNVWMNLIFLLFSPTYSLVFKQKSKI